VCTLSLLLPLLLTATATTFYKSSREPACERAPFERGRAIIIIIIICLQASLLRPVGISKQLEAANQRTTGLAASKTREFGLAP
jgi:hypothetical protein